MSIVMNCQSCNEPDACHEHQTDDSVIWMCDGCASESTKCTSCGVITDYYDHDEMGFITCHDCLGKEAIHE
ncbi:hypothetical protein L4D09_19630 [Photobacterium makurazakiensis]|uniref:hypothetical protein n=1 Tax=Photobacterium makurazakiensis TaxID=2910234 RepID=UPI003D0C7378